MKSLDAPETTSVLRDWLDQVLGRILKAIFSHHGLFVLTGFVITAFLFAGTPMIRSDIQILRFLSQSTPEVQDFKFVEANLTNISFLELMLESDDHMFKDPQAWKKVFDLEKNLREIPEVVSTESLLPLLEYLDRLTNPGTKGYGDLFTNPKLIPQLLVLFSLSPETQKLRRSFLDDDFDRVRVAVRIKNSPSVPIAETIEQVRLKADSVMKGTARVTVTGDLAMYASQTSDYVEDQIHSMFLASILITILMIIQMGSIVLGLISLLPNIPPVAAVFGIMGWFGVSLDGVTVFAATVAIGLAVDNTIHYLAQLKRDIRFRRNQPVESLVGVAYQLTAKQIASWTTVTLLGFLALAVSPFRPVVLFGILGCSAITLGLFGDLVFMQSLILTSARIRNTITKLVEKEMAAEK
jgi:predicted RND superfamily exporter protein